MSETTHQTNYMKIFGWLLALTVVEVGIVYAHLPHRVLALSLVTLALWKAFLVAWHFMHLKSEKRTLILTVGFPLVLLIILLAGLMPDIGRLPF